MFNLFIIFGIVLIILCLVIAAANIFVVIYFCGGFKDYKLEKIHEKPKEKKPVKKTKQKKKILTESFDRLAQRQGSEYLSVITKPDKKKYNKK